jgi:bifunctional ADP-heptose synthase (sugar kinase/adenylyltransferase)
MTKKHYTAVAAILLSEYDKGNLSDMAQYELARHFADMFESDNKSFNRVRFYRACGLCSNGARIVNGDCHCSNHNEPN